MNQFAKIRNAPAQFEMFSAPVPSITGLTDYGVTTDPQIELLLRRDAIVAVGVSGGKDSQACAIAVARHLDAIGHAGPRILVHADLGRVEWRDSLPACERLAEHLGWELLVVRRQAGDMLARWEGRWAANLARYIEMQSVKIILPWSTPAMRFCTSELKTDVICSALRKRWPSGAIINITGIRREESSNRQKKPVAGPMAKLARRDGEGFEWNAIIDQPLEWVFSTIAQEGLALHEAYGLGSSRVSCAFCIMSSLPDLTVAAGCEANQDLYRQMVALETASTFAFQGARWLGDVAPHLLGVQGIKELATAKERAARRVALEERIPDHLLYTKGWPTFMPSNEEALMLAEVRRGIASVLGCQVKFTTAAEITDRYRELLEMAAQTV